MLLHLALVLAQTIHVTPEDSLADAAVKIRVAGLAPRQVAIIRASTNDADGTEWQSWAGFVSDENGGTEIVDPMRLFWSMDVAGDAHGKRRFNTAGLEAMKVQLSLEVDGKQSASTIATRRFRAQDVTRSDIRTANIIGTLFTPRHPRGAVLVIGGSEGGIGDENVAAVLASRGYLVLAIAYFGIDPLPKSLAEIPLETFFNAIDFLKKQAATVSIVATSKGAEAALLVAARRSDIAAVVAFAPSSVVWSCICDEPKSSWTAAGKPLPFVPAGRDPAYAPPRGFPIEPGVHYRYRLRSAPRDASIDVRNITARLMLIAGDDDRLWPSEEMATSIALHRRSRKDEVITVPGADHLIAKAYLPAGSTRVGNGRIETGGTPRANARGSWDAWPKVLRFLDESRR